MNTHINKLKRITGTTLAAAAFAVASAGLLVPATASAAPPRWAPQRADHRSRDHARTVVMRHQDFRGERNYRDHRDYRDHRNYRDRHDYRDRRPEFDVHVYRYRQPYVYAYRAAPVYGTTPVYRSTSADNALVGGLIGAAVGGVVGSNIGNGNGRLAATAAGTVLGFVVGGSIGHDMPYAR